MRQARLHVVAAERGLQRLVQRVELAEAPVRAQAGPVRALGVHPVVGDIEVIGRLFGCIESQETGL